MKFFLHIGSPKAGSSYLQTLCARTRAPLAKSGVHFPCGTRHDERCMSAGRISAGNAQQLARQVAEGRWTEAEHLLRCAADEARSCGCDQVLLSSEWLLGALATDERLIELTRLLAQLGGHAVELLLVLREPVGQFISLYKHRAKSGAAGDIDAWAEHGYDLPCHLAGIRRQVEAIDTKASGVKLTVRGYGKEAGALERLFFEEWLGVPAPDESSRLRVNPSLSLSELVLLRQLRACHPGLVPYLYSRLLEVDPDRRMEGKDIQEHARRVAGYMVGREGGEWAYWNALLPPAERFGVPEPGPRPGPEPDRLELSTAQMAVLTELLADAVRPRLLLELLWSWRLRPALARVKRIIWPWHASRSAAKRPG